MSNLASRIERALGEPVSGLAPLSGGCVAQVMLARFESGRCCVVKTGGDKLDLEGWMLGFLEGKLPVPKVLLAEPDLLIMSHLETSGGGMDQAAECHCAELLAALHAQGASQYGLERDTLIGGLVQPNPPGPRWIPFFAEHRLLYMAKLAHQENRLSTGTLARIERLAGRLDRWLAEPSQPSLIHGDLWGGNILSGKGRIVGFIDPAIYHADPEIELAFGTMFGTFGQAFFSRYDELRPIAPDFFEIRKDLYNLYPLLVHVRLFGASYLGGVKRILEGLGV